MPPRAGDVGMDTAKLTARLPAGTIRPWPADPAHVPEDREWHARREGDYPAGTIARCLYGDGWPESREHPLRLVPGAGD
jgi:hypothetical protein